MKSRANLARPAVRQEMKARLMLSGPSGAGKTRTALIIASHIGSSTCVIDTEHGSARTYADDFDFVHIDWQPPYDPRELAATIAELSYDTIIVDSLSHFWKGEGGTLDIANGDFRGWKEATPAQDDMVTAALRSPAHIILCVRSKMHYEAEQRGDRMRVTKVGLAPIQRDDLEYELNVSARMSMEHVLAIDKTRCPVLADREFRPGRAHEMAELYAAWLAGGEPVAPPEVVREITDRINALGDDARKACKAEFVAKIGRPELLRESQIDAAHLLVAEYEPQSGQEPGTTPASVPTSLTSQPSEAPALPTPDPVGADGTLSLPVDEPDPPAVTPPGENPNPMTDRQSKALHALLRSKRNAAGPNRFPVLTEMVGREITTTKDLTFEEASMLIDRLQEEDSAA